MTMLSTVPMSADTRLDRPVESLMRAGVLMIPARASLALAARAMASHDVHAVLVADGPSQALGWVTARGLLHNHARDWQRATAAEAATEPVVTVPLGSTLRCALDAFVGSGASHVLVADAAGALVGTLADSDLARHTGASATP